MAVEVGQQAPDFAVKDDTGEMVSLSQFRGRNVVHRLLSAGIQRHVHRGRL